MSQKLVKTVDDVHKLVDILPEQIRTEILSHNQLSNLIEIVLDLGRKAEIRFTDSYYRFDHLPDVSFQDIDTVTKKVGAFTTDNRAGIERTLHRISAMRNREGKIVGLTCRIGRAVFGTIENLRDIIESGKNILFLGAPGVGKTTKLRETARVLAVEFYKRVVVVDTSNEIAGDGDIPHPGIGTARRMQVPSPDRQHSTMIEAVENHMPEVIIVDEIGTEQEAHAARTIAERGVQLIATAHGYTIENLLKNPILSDLIGGIQSVILGDEEAKFRGTQKTVLERKSAPTFDILVELKGREVCAIYHNVAECVDALLRNDPIQPEIRNGGSEEQPSAGTAYSGGAVVSERQSPAGVSGSRETSAVQKGASPASARPDASSDFGALVTATLPSATGWVQIFPFGINQKWLLSAIHALNVPIRIVNSVSEADLILTTASKAKAKNALNRIQQDWQVPLHVIRQNNPESIARFIRDYFRLTENEEAVELETIREAEHGCELVMNEQKPVDLSPRNAYLRRIQHNEIKLAGLHSVSVGKEPNRRVRIYPSRAAS